MLNKRALQALEQSHHAACLLPQQSHVNKLQSTEQQSIRTKHQHIYVHKHTPPLTQSSTRHITY